MSEFNEKLRGTAPGGKARSIDEIPEDEAAKVLKILTLAKGGTTEAEVDAALAAAFKLAIKHDLDLSTMTGEEVEKRRKGLVRDPIVESVVQVAKGSFRRPPSSRFVLGLLDDFFRVSVLTGMGRNSSKVFIYGKRSDVKRAEYTMFFLFATFNREWKEYRDRTGAEPSSRASFFKGMWLSIHRKLEREETDAKSRAFAEMSAAGDQREFDNRYAMVTSDAKEEIDGFVKEKNERIVYTKTRERSDVDYGALDAGHEAGRNVSFAEALEGGSTGLNNRERIK